MTIDQSMDSVMEMCFWAVPSLMVAAAAWMIILPPRKIRRWPNFMRPVFGLATGQAAVYALLFGVVRPLINAHFEAHDGNIILDYPVDMLQPVHFLVGGVVISGLIWVAYLLIRPS